MTTKKPGAVNRQFRVRKALKKPLARIATLGFDFTIGTSGTAATLAELAAKMSTNGEGISSGLTWLSRRRLEELIDILAPIDVDARVRRLGLDPKRAATIVGGAITLDEIMEALEVEQLRVCDAALREGIVEAAMAKRSARSDEPAPAGSVRRAGVIGLAEKTHIDMTHARHVANLALRIFDQTQEQHLLRTGERELLEYAALLHEAGMHVSYQGHHKHSYYLISHAGLRGLTADQVAVIANVVRYHRKGTPDETDRNFAQLSRPQRDVVMKLAAILRVADALDRGRRGAVRDIAVDAGKKRFRFRLRLRDRADVEREAVARKTKYFARVFDRPVDFEIAAR